MARRARTPGPQSRGLLRPGPFGSAEVVARPRERIPFGKSFQRERTRLTRRFRTFTYKPQKGTRFTPNEVVAIIRDHIKDIPGDSRIVVRGRGGVPGGSPKEAAPQNRYWSSFAIRQDQLSTMDTSRILTVLGLEGNVSVVRITNER